MKRPLRFNVAYAALGYIALLLALGIFGQETWTRVLGGAAVGLIVFALAAWRIHWVRSTPIRSYRQYEREERRRDAAN